MNQEEFLADLVNFLESRGHGRLIPPAGVDAFPEVVLNGKRLDLYNLYREVLYSGSRGMYEVLGFVSGLFGSVIVQLNVAQSGAWNHELCELRIKTRCLQELTIFS